MFPTVIIFILRRVPIVLCCLLLVLDHSTYCSMFPTICFSTQGIMFPPTCTRSILKTWESRTRVPLQYRMDNCILTNPSLQMFSEQGVSLREKDWRAPAVWIIALSDWSPLNYPTNAFPNSPCLQLKESCPPNVFIYSFF